MRHPCRLILDRQALTPLRLQSPAGGGIIARLDGGLRLPPQRGPMTTRRRTYLAVFLTGMLVLAGTRLPGGAVSDGDPWGTVRVPGGYSALHDAVRLSAPVDEWRTLPLLIEMSHAGIGGLRTRRLIESYARSLRETGRQGGAAPEARLPGVDGEAPLPLGVDWWTSRFDPAPPPEEL